LSGNDFLTLAELSQRLQLSPKALRRLYREKGFPIWRATPHGPYYAYWSEVAKWLAVRRREMAVKVKDPAGTRS
jgi:hypothetical protein